MPWVRGGDTAHSHRKLLRAQERDAVRGLAVFGFVHACASWSSQELLDGFISESACRRIGGEDTYLQLVKDAQAAGMMQRGRARGPAGERGWAVANDDPDFLHIRLKEEVERDRDKSRATRQIGPQRDVRLRDGDQCRYCGKTVNWNDRRSARGGTYDHPDPDGPRHVRRLLLPVQPGQDRPHRSAVGRRRRPHPPAPARPPPDRPDHRHPVRRQPVHPGHQRAPRPPGGRRSDPATRHPAGPRPAGTRSPHGRDRT